MLTSEIIEFVFYTLLLNDAFIVLLHMVIDFSIKNNK